MSLFLDTSTLLKLYVEERGSVEARRTVTGEAPVRIAFLAPHEFLSALRRKVQEHVLRADVADEVWAAFRDRSPADFPIVPFTPALSDRALALLDRHGGEGLRTLDAFQLACGAESGGAFLTADRRLEGLARSAGLRTILVP